MIYMDNPTPTAPQNIIFRDGKEYLMSIAEDPVTMKTVFRIAVVYEGKTLVENADVLGKQHGKDTGAEIFNKLVKQLEIQMNNMAIKIEHGIDDSLFDSLSAGEGAW